MSVGIDVGTRTIKVVELSKSGDKYKLKASGVIGYTGVDPDKLNDEKDFVPIVEALKKLYKEAKIYDKKVSIALPEFQVFTRTVSLPQLTDQEVSSAIKWEAEQYVPIPLSEAILQHQILERRDNNTPPDVLVLLVAAQKSLVEKYVKIVSMAGLNCVGVETELLSIVRSLAPSDQTVLIADIGAKGTDLAISKNGMLVFSRSIPTAGDAFTRAVAQSLGINATQAEQYKRTYGMSKDQLEGKVKQALDPIVRIVGEEIKKAMHFYQSEDKGESPGTLILTGGVTGMPDIVPTLSKILGIEVIIGNPFSKVEVDPKIAQSLQGYYPLYPVAVGLALRGD